MNSSGKYYSEKLYPLQDGVMNIIKKLNTPFFLTGGTALSRHYFNHRFSDDLDLFVISDDNFTQLTDKVLLGIFDAEKNGRFVVDKENVRRFKNFTQLFVYSNDKDVKLKIDFVNDVAAHFGTFESDALLGKIDSWRNILSNKISAVFRFEAKDVADIWALAKNRSFNWKEIISEAKSKEAGVEPEVIFNILKSFPVEQLSIIKWNQMFLKTDLVEFSGIFSNDINQIAEDIFWGKMNSLFERGNAAEY